MLIEVARRRHASLLAPWEALAADPTQGYYSPVSAAELWRGVRSGEEPVLDGMFAALTCLVIDDATGRKAGDFLRRYARSHGLEIADALIAATAAVHELALWTRNVKHYPMPDVKFYSPR